MLYMFRRNGPVLHHFVAPIQVLFFCMELCIDQPVVKLKDTIKTQIFDALDFLVGNNHGRMRHLI